MHWSIQYVGKAWLAGGRGPDAFDCWGLIWEVYRTRYGIELPQYPNMDPAHHLAVGKAIDAGTRAQEWEQVATPFEGCVVAMSQRRIFHHVGLFLNADGGLILHAHDRGNVVAQKRASLTRSGWHKVAYFKHRDFPQ